MKFKIGDLVETSDRFNATRRVSTGLVVSFKPGGFPRDSGFGAATGAMIRYQILVDGELSWYFEEQLDLVQAKEDEDL